jgi:parallel beta-helix repeat protein
MKKTAVIVLILISLMTLGAICVRPAEGQYQGNITINADGSISPSTASIQQTGNTYTLTSDVNGSITVLKSNIILDGNGHAIIGGSAEIGIGGILIGSLPTAPTSGLSFTSNILVKNFTVTGSVFGISLWATSNVTVANNTIKKTGNGILALDQSTAGINVEGGGSNIITQNNLVDNYNAMSFLQTQNNLIIGNKITSNSNPYVSVSAVMFWHSSNNTIYHNNFVNNAAQAGDSDSVNVWDNGYPDGGNYWSDYKARYPNANEIDSSRIADTPYVIDSQNMDRYPLMYAFNEYYVLQATPPKVSLLSPVNGTYNETSVPLVFSVDKSVNWAAYSLDGQQNVTITGNDTIVNMTNGFHSVTVYANDTFGNIGASENITFTIALAPIERSETFPTATVAAVLGATALAIGAGLIVYFKKRHH